MYFTKADLVGVVMNKEASEAALLAAAQATNGTNSALLALGSGLVAIAAVAYLWQRRIKMDNRDFTTLQFALDENAKAMQLYRQSAEDANNRVVAITERLETVSQERNDAVQKLGQFTATIEHLQETVERLERDNKVLIDRIDKLLKIKGE